MNVELAALDGAWKQYMKTLRKISHCPEDQPLERHLEIIARTYMPRQAWRDDLQYGIKMTCEAVHLTPEGACCMTQELHEASQSPAATFPSPIHLPMNDKQTAAVKAARAITAATAIQANAMESVLSVLETRAFSVGFTTEQRKALHAAFEACVGPTK